MLEVVELSGTIELSEEQTESDTWILKLPGGVCRREGLAEGTLVSLTLKDGGLRTSLIRPPAQKLQEISARLLRKNRRLYEELKRLS